MKRAQALFPRGMFVTLVTRAFRRIIQGGPQVVPATASIVARVSGKPTRRPRMSRREYAGRIVDESVRAFAYRAIVFP